MMETKEVKNISESTFNHLADYVDNFYKINVLKATAKTSGIGSGIITTAIFYSFVMIALLLAGAALGWWIGDLVNSRPGGFLIAAIFFLFVLLLLFVSRKKLLLPYFRNWLIRKLYE